MFAQKLYRISSFVVAVAVIATVSFLCAQGSVIAAPSDAERAWLEYVINPNMATAIGFNRSDSAGHSMDGTKVIQDPCGGYFAVYHWLNGSIFQVGLAQSTDLMNWTYVRTLGSSHASQPYIYMDNNGGYVVAWEIDGPCRNFLEYFPTRATLLSGSPTNTWDENNPYCTHLTYEEGTPTIDYVKWNGAFGDITNSTIYVQFHCYPYPDKYAYGTLTNFTTWSSSRNTAFDYAMESQGYNEIGQSDRVITTQNGSNFDLVEASYTQGDWYHWKIFVYDWQTGGADRLDWTTPAGSYGFCNPRITQLSTPTKNAGYLVSVFMPSETSAPGEANGCLYYIDYASQILLNGDFEEIRPDNNPPVGFRFFAVSGATGSWASTTGSGQYTGGNRGIQITYNNPPTGDSGLDMWPTLGGGPCGVPMFVSPNHIYKLSVNAKNASGQKTFNTSLQFLDSSCNPISYPWLNFGQYLSSSTWQMFEQTAKSDANAVTLSARFDVRGTAASSVYIDRAYVFDTTTANRALNGSLENSSLTPIQWTVSKSGSAAGSLALNSTNHYDGSYSALYSVTAVGSGISANNDKVAVIPGEQFHGSFACKKVSGAKLRVTISQWNSSGGLVATNAWVYTPTTSWATYTTPSVTINASAVTASLAYQIVATNGTTLTTGSCYLDAAYLGR